MSESIRRLSHVKSRAPGGARDSGFQDVLDRYYSRALGNRRERSVRSCEQSVRRRCADHAARTGAAPSPPSCLAARNSLQTLCGARLREGWLSYHTGAYSCAALSRQPAGSSAGPPCGAQSDSNAILHMSSPRGGAWRLGRGRDSAQSALELCHSVPATLIMMCSLLSSSAMPSSDAPPGASRLFRRISSNDSYHAGNGCRIRHLDDPWVLDDAAWSNRPVSNSNSNQPHVAICVVGELRTLAMPMVVSRVVTKDGSRRRSGYSVDGL